MDDRLRVSSLLSGMVTITSPSASCLVGSLTATLEGTLSLQLDFGTTLDVSFFDTNVAMDMITYGIDCVPVAYRLKFNGSASFTLTPPEPALVATNGLLGGPSFQVEFKDLFLTQHAITNPVTTEISGKMSSDCWGAEVTIGTLESVAVPVGDICPSAGELSLTSSFGVATVTYDNGAVTVVEGGSEKNFPSCLSEELVTCIPQ